MKELSWKPELNGDVYCSPACGMGCKKSEHDWAVKYAATLAEVMGEGWEPNVWENCGWNFSVKKGCASVHPSYIYPASGRDSSGKYTVYINTNPQFIARGTDPRLTLIKGLADLKEHIRALQSQVAEVCE